ncbi:hypothetical protein G2W53_029767 [Senna tora]|uniref:Uncharacterized protein n=1 Tax=Senna tora TaxID=362788 RepID=A0A834T410_9FABA|nr:hypothetical protein G2W53_029767 [Senna tora]
MKSIVKRMVHYSSWELDVSSFNYKHMNECNLHVISQILHNSDKEHKVKNPLVRPHLFNPKKMPQSLLNFPTKPNPETTLLQPEAFGFSTITPTKQNKYKSINFSTGDTKEDMDELPPVEVGTRGTVGSLVMQEMEFFSQIESNKARITNKGSSNSRDSNVSNNAASTKKKRGSGSNSKLLPSMCSMVDVSSSSSSDKSRPNGTSAFSYKNLNFEKPNFLRRLVIGVAQALSGFPHFMSTTSTMLGIFFSFFSLIGVLSTTKPSDPSIGIRWLCRPLIFVFWAIPEEVLWLPLLLLLLASSDDFLGCSLLGLPLLLLETESVLGLVLEDTCFSDAEEILCSNSLVIKALIVPVVPTLMDPPPPLMPSRVWV